MFLVSLFLSLFLSLFSFKQKKAFLVSPTAYADDIGDPFELMNFGLRAHAFLDGSLKCMCHVLEMSEELHKRGMGVGKVLD